MEEYILDFDLKALNRINSGPEIHLKLIIRIVSLLFLCVLITTSCTRYISTYPLPGITGGSPLRGIQPTSFFINNFEDQRTVQDLIGIGSTQKIKTKTDVTKTITEALAAELIRNGHSILKVDNLNRVDFIINGNVLVYWFECISGVSKVTCSGKVETKIMVTNVHHPEIVLTKQYSGYYELKEGLITWPEAVTIFNEAMMNMIKEFTTDIDFINLLQAK